MQPAAVLAVIVKAQGVTATNAQLKAVNSTLVATNTAATAAAGSVQKAGARTAAAGAVMSRAGRGINRNVGLPLLAVSALSAKAAIDFEDSFADIRKTVAATEPQFKRLETGVRRLSQKIPISVNELNRLGGQAGALGIHQKDLLSFIKTAAELGTTTELSSEEAATSLARLSNIMKTPTKQFRNLASTFVDLGNKGASTEQEIAAMSLRIAGAGETLGLAEHEVLGLAAALANVGIHAEMGGTAVSRIMLQMQEAVAKGGGELKEFARITGVSTDEFERRFRQSVPKTVAEFSAGIGRLNKEGKPILSTLKEVELGERRVGDTILRIAGNTEQFTRSQKIASAEWRRNNALTAEAQRRYGTTASKVQLAKNKIYDLGNTIGQNLLPVIADVLGMLGDVIGVFANLPSGTQQVILKFMTLVAIFGIIVTLAEKLITLAGKLVSAYAAVARGITWLTTAQTANTAATQAATVANTEYTASLIAAAGAQRQLLIANKSGAVVGSMPIATTTVAGKAGEAVGKTGAARIAAGFARFLPGALALVGIGSIMESALTGDSENAMKKIGGAAGGALIGGIIGSVVPGIGTVVGALAGGGIGSIVGGMIGGAADDGVTRWEQKVRESMDRVRNASSGVQAAFANVGTAQKRLTGIGKDQARVAGKIERTEARLEAFRKSGKVGSPAIQREERKLNRLRSKSQSLIRQQWHWERNLGGSRNVAKQSLRGLRKAEVENIRLKQQNVEAAKRQERRAYRLRDAHLAQGRGYKVLMQDEKRIRKASERVKEAEQARDRAQRRLANTMKEIASNFGPKYAQHLRRTIPLWTSTKEQVRATERFMRRLAPGLVPITVQIRNFGNQGKDATTKVKKGYEGVKGALGPFRSESRTQLNRATNDLKDWRKASVTGVGIVENKLGSFAGALGIKGVTFGVRGGKGKPKKQRGGGIKVPGAGAGDKVPLTAWVEPGEEVFVLNKRAAKDKEKLNALATLNREVGRFQTGGALRGSFNVDGAKPGFVPFMNFLNSLYGPLYVMSGLRPGAVTTSGNMSNHATGNAVDISTTQGGLNFATDERSLNATGAAAKRMDALYSYMAKYIKLPGDFLWRTDTGGNHWNHIHRGITSAHASNPELMMAYLSRLPKGEAFGGIGKLIFEGPDGQLKKIGQQILDQATKMANQWLTRHMQTAQYGTGPMPAGGLHGLDGPGKIVGASTYHPDAVTGTVGAAGESLIGRMAYAELGMGKNLGGLPFGHKLKISRAGQSVIGEKLDIGAGGGDVQGYRRDIDLWHETANAIGLPDDWLGLVRVQGLQRGGIARMAKGDSKKGKGSIASGIKSTLKGLAQGKHMPKYRAQLKKIGRRIAGIGLSRDRVNRLSDLTKDAEKFAEYASNASALTTQDEAGNVFQGKFKERTEGEWLNEQLGALMQLRREVIAAHGVLESKQVPRVMKLLKQAKQRLLKVRKAIRDAENMKREMVRKIKEIERARKKSEEKLKQEIKQIERQIAEARRNKPPATKGNKAVREAAEKSIDNLEIAKEAKKRELDSAGKGPNEEIRKLRKKVRGIEKAQRGRRRVESALTGKIIPDLRSKHTSLVETMDGLLGDGGAVQGKSFFGLRQIQGAGGTGEIPNPPPLGSVGGEIFAVQNRLREIQEEAKRTKLAPKDESTMEELLEIERELNLNLRKENLVLKHQFATLQNFPSVASVAGPVLPYAGAFALGGSVVAKVGERGAEMAVMPSGSRIVTKTEAREAVVGAGVRSGPNSFKFEEVNFHEGEDRVSGRMNGTPFDQRVEKVNRKQSLRSMARTPGGQGLR